MIEISNRENERDPFALGPAVFESSTVTRLEIESRFSMSPFRVVKSLLVLVVAFAAVIGGEEVAAQDLRAEIGSGWAIPASDVIADATINGEEGELTIDPGAGPHAYAAVGLSWTISSNFALTGQLRAQQSRMRGSPDQIRGCGEGECSSLGDPDGRIRLLALEGRIALTSVGRINPYFLVSLGIARTTVDEGGVEVDGTVAQFEETSVTDAGGDVGLGASTPIIGGLSLNAEIRATGSLPGGRENSVTTFPFSLGMSYQL